MQREHMHIITHLPHTLNTRWETQTSTRIPLISNQHHRIHLPFSISDNQNPGIPGWLSRAISPPSGNLPSPLLPNLQASVWIPPAPTPPTVGPGWPGSGPVYPEQAALRGSTVQRHVSALWRKLVPWNLLISVTWHTGRVGTASEQERWLGNWDEMETKRSKEKENEQKRRQRRLVLRGLSGGRKIQEGKEMHWAVDPPRAVT